MPFLPVRPENAELVALAVDIVNAANRVDDPDAIEELPELTALWLTYGWDLEPAEKFLYFPDGSDTAVGVLDIEHPMRDNRELVWGGVVVRPEHRRRGHGTAMVQEVLRRTRELGRSIVWIGAVESDPGARAFLERFGFAYASHDARRRQRLADVDRAELGRLHAEAVRAAADYEVVRQVAPTPDDLLAELVAVTAAINDAPMGELVHENEVFDLQRLKDVETASAGIGHTVYRIYARHKQTGEIGGHTVMVSHPLEPALAHQGDTAVSREHRGHRLGLLLKIEMMRWLAEVEPQLELIETWNHADNTFMINVNEAIGYRLSQVFAAYQLLLAPPAPSADRDTSLASATA
ncbi:MAG TPA: GNAT family N-acetyltransferase [Propionibacteriaceae bacterium]|nr:GNAT family N-acetyltransferase [Propionibacteriaceae bacterium]